MHTRMASVFRLLRTLVMSPQQKIGVVSSRCLQTMHEVVPVHQCFAASACNPGCPAVVGSWTTVEAQTLNCKP